MQGPWEGHLVFFLHARPLHHGPKSLKKWWGHEKFLESCKETSTLSVDVFWGRWDHIVAQKSIVKIFFFEKVLNSCTPPG